MTDQSDETRLTDVLKRLVEECPHPERLIELYYWSAEPDLAEVMRQYVGLSPEVRAAFYAFLTLVRDGPGSVTVKIAANGDMSFSSPAAVELARKIVEPAVPRMILH
jgi:hypothetical protein